MSVVPNTVLGKIQFCEAHIDPWVLNAVPMGSSAAAVTSWSTLVTAARSAYETQKAAQLAARDSTINLNNAMRTLMHSTASIIKQVRAKADLSGTGVYALASLPAPELPSPTPPPGKPYELSVELDESGALKLKWKCDNPAGTRGTFYQMWRRVGADGDFDYIGGSGDKVFVDSSLPAGASQVTYQIQAVRTTQVGPVAQFNVNFGVGAATEPVTVEEPMPRAAA